jgi:hypothetical protein
MVYSGRTVGIPESTLLLRDALPFQVTEVFLVERQSGLLLQHLSHDPETAEDSDLVSGMLTTIRDFVQDTFGRDRVGEVDLAGLLPAFLLISVSAGFWRSRAWSICHDEASVVRSGCVPNERPTNWVGRCSH